MGDSNRSIVIITVVLSEGNAIILTDVIHIHGNVQCSFFKIC